jgi:glycosyltransferase involved in cell wall biosynthesis
MRIAIVTETWPSEINGVALTVHSFVEHLAAQGHAIDLVRPEQAHASALALPASVDELTVRGAALPRYPGLRFGLPAGATLKARWLRQRPDAVYIATEGPLGWSAMRAATALRIPVATGFHTRFDDFVAHYGARWLTPIVFAWLRRFHNRGDATLVPTRELEGFLREHGFRNPVRLARGVDTRLFDPARRDPALRHAWGLDDDGLAVIYVGRIAPEKNLELAVEAFGAIRAERPDARMVWIGDGPAREALEAAHPEHVFAGMRRGEDLARHFASGDLFLFPSLTETFGNVTLESLASGVPVVAFDYGAAREHVRDGIEGRVVPCDARDRFVEAAVALAREPALRRRMGGAGRRAMLKLDPAAVAADLAGILAGLGQRRAA